MKARSNTFYRMCRGGLTEDALLTLVTDKMRMHAAQDMAQYVARCRAAWEDGFADVVTYRPPQWGHSHGILVRRDLNVELAEVPDCAGHLYRRVVQPDLTRCILDPDDDLTFEEIAAMQNDQTEEFRLAGKCYGISVYFEE